IAPARQSRCIKFVQAKQSESALAVPDFVADERRSQAATNDVRKVPGARHAGAIERARTNDQVGPSFFCDAKHDRNIFRLMLAVAVEGDYLGKAVFARESDAGAQGRGLAAIFWQSQTSSSGSLRDVRCSVDRSIVDHHHLCNML